MKRILSFAFVLALAGGSFSTVHGQVEASGNLTANATLSATSAIAQESSLDFGTIFAGTSTALVSTADHGARGRLLITGPNGAEVTVTAEGPGTLNFDDGQDVHEITIEAILLAWHASDPSDDSQLDETAADLAVILSGTGEAYVFVGATLTDLATKPAGLYTGTITINIEQAY
jgi:spore coat protein U-like protein